MKPEDYKGIMQWHLPGGSKPYYIHDQQQKAARDNAPADAVYWSITDNKWVCVSDLTLNDPFRMKWEGRNVRLVTATKEEQIARFKAAQKCIDIAMVRMVDGDDWRKPATEAMNTIEAACSQDMESDKKK